MIAALVRTDPARRAIPMFILVGLPAGLVLRGIRVAVPGGLDLQFGGAGSGPAMMLAALSLWAMAISLLLSAGITSRGSVFASGLPVPARTLWIARMLSIVAAAALPVATMIAVAAIEWGPRGVPTVHLPTALLGLRLLAALLLPLAVLQAIRPELRSLRSTRGERRRLAGAAVLSLLVVAGPLPAGWTLALAFVAALALAVLTYRRLPPAFSLVGRELEATPPPSAASTEREGGGRAGAATRALARVLLNHAAAWFILPVLVLYGFQTLLVHQEGSDALLLLLLPTIWIPFVALHSMSRVGPLDPLPIPRRRLFRWCVLPAVAAYLVGLAIYTPIARLLPETLALVRLQRNGLRTPSEFWEFAPGGRPPSIVAPWGEAHLPRARALLPGLETAIYFPFEAPADASPRYFAWQARRALAAVHGGDPTNVPAPEEGDPLVRQMEARGNVRYSENVPGSLGAASVAHARTLLIFGFGPLLFWLLFGWMGMHPRLTGRARGTILGLGLGIPVVLVVVVELAAIGSGVPSAPLSIAASIVTRKFADALSIGLVPLAACVVLFGVVVYRILGRRFERFEAPLRPAKTLVAAWRGAD